MIEELHALGKGIIEEMGGAERALYKYITAMNPTLPSAVGVFDPAEMKIISVINPRTNPAAAEKYIIYTSGARDTPANYSPSFRPKDTDKRSAEENIADDMDTLLKWKHWPEEYKNIFVRIKERSKEIAEEAKKAGVEYAVIQINGINGKAHTEDPTVLKYFLDQISKKKLLKDAVDGTCMICGKKGKVTGAALRLANLKFSTPDKEVFVPIGAGKEKAFSAQFPLCEEDAITVMVGTAFAASETAGKLRGTIAKVGTAVYEFIVLPMSKADHERDAIQLSQNKNPEEIAALEDVDQIAETLSKNQENPILEQIFKQMLSPIEYVSIYFTEKTKATSIIGSIRHVTPNTLAKLVNARNVAQISTDDWFGKAKEHAPRSWMSKKTLFHDLIALQISEEKISDNEIAVALKRAIQEYVLALDGQWERTENWLKHTITTEAGRMLLNGKDVRRYLRRGVATVLTVKSMRRDANMSVEELIEVVKSRPDQYVAFLAGLLSAEAMRYQRNEKKNIKIGEEPFRKVVGNAATGDLEDFKRVLVLAVDKINQYGGSPRWAIKDYPIDVPELLSVKKISKTEDIRFAFVLGLLVGETRFVRKPEEDGGEENGEEA